MKKYKTIIISDLHLGTKNSKYKKVLDFLQNNSSENLILNGDIIDLRYIKIFGGWPKGHTEVLQYIIEIAKNNQTNVFYMPGNHDDFLKNIVPLEYENIKLRRNMIYQAINGKAYYICHGDNFDKIEGKLFILSFISFVGATFLYRINRIYNNRREKKGLKYFSIISKIKRLAKVIMVGGNKKFYSKLYNTAKQNNCDGIICGHVHKAENTMIKDINYLNSGDRVDSLTAITEDFDGNWNIYYSD